MPLVAGAAVHNLRDTKVAKMKETFIAQVE